MTSFCKLFENHRWKVVMMLSWYYHLFLSTLRDNCHLFSTICHIKQYLNSRFARCSKIVSICIFESHSLSWGSIMDGFQNHVVKRTVSTSNYIVYCLSIMSLYTYIYIMIVFGKLIHVSTAVSFQLPACNTLPTIFTVT